MKSKTTYILWAVYLCLLLVLLPHTAWAFGSMEPAGSWFPQWVAAIAFEAAIAVLTHKLAKHIETTSRVKGWLKKFAARYLNPFGVGLAMATLVSALANMAHAVEFGQPIKIFTQLGIPSAIYSLTLGGILPLASLVFARVLSDVVDTEDAPNPELEEAKQTLTDLRSRLRDSESQRRAAEDRVRAAEDRVRAAEDQVRVTEERANAAEELARAAEEQVKVAAGLVKAAEDRANVAEGRARLAEERFGAIGDLVKYLFGEDKRQRIITAHRQWPQLPGAAIAIIASSSPGYVSEVLRDVEMVDAQP